MLTWLVVLAFSRVVVQWSVLLVAMVVPFAVPADISHRRRLGLHAASPSTCLTFKHRRCAELFVGESVMCVFKVYLPSCYCGDPIDVPIRPGEASGCVEASSSGGCLATGF
jgi:hypothetical protein